MRFATITASVALLIASVAFVQAAPVPDQDQWAKLENLITACNENLHEEAVSIKTALEGYQFADAYAHFVALRTKAKTCPNYADIQTTLYEIIENSPISKLFPSLNNQETNTPAQNTTHTPTQNTTNISPQITTNTAVLLEDTSDQLGKLYREKAEKFKEWCESHSGYKDLLKKAIDALQAAHWDEAKEWYEKAKQYAREHYPDYADYQQYLEKWEKWEEETKQSLPSQWVEESTEEYNHTYITDLKKLKEDLLKFIKWIAHDEYLEAAIREACQDFDEGHYGKANSEFVKIKNEIKEKYPDWQELVNDVHKVTTDYHH